MSFHRDVLVNGRVWVLTGVAVRAGEPVPVWSAALLAQRWLAASSYADATVTAVDLDAWRDGDLAAYGREGVLVALDPVAGAAMLGQEPVLVEAGLSAREGC